MNRDEQTRPTGADSKRDEAESLIWAMLDQQLDEAEIGRLGAMLAEDADLRTLYIDCVQLHVDLREHFARQTANHGKSTIVLSNLLPGLPGPQGAAQVTE